MVHPLQNIHRGSLHLSEDYKKSDVLLYNTGVEDKPRRKIWTNQMVVVIESNSQTGSGIRVWSSSSTLNVRKFAGYMMEDEGGWDKEVMSVAQVVSL